MGLIYFIQCLETNEIYIGSTTMTIEDRMKCHIKKGNRCYSKQIIDGDNYIYDILEEVDGDKLLEREQHYMDTTDCINKYRAFGFDKKVYGKKYHLDNKDILNENHLEYCKKKITCECGNTYSRGNKSRHLKTKRHLSGIKDRESSTF